MYILKGLKKLNNLSLTSFSSGGKSFQFNSWFRFTYGYLYIPYWKGKRKRQLRAAFLC